MLRYREQQKQSRDIYELISTDYDNNTSAIVLEEHGSLVADVSGMVRADKDLIKPRDTGVMTKLGA
jgi:hypothetical protein